MGTATIYQPTLPLGIVGKFPSTRYQGSKAKLANWIWEQVSDLDFLTCLDAFGGTGAVGYRLKQEDKQVTYNDCSPLQLPYRRGTHREQPRSPQS